jgi:hypothetical protein
MNNEIIGIWETDQNDTKSLQVYGNVTIEFKLNGDLIYTTRLKGNIQKMFMTYEIKDNQLITSQALTQEKEKTDFKFLSDGKLELAFDRIKSTYIKANNESSASLI